MAAGPLIAIVGETGSGKSALGLHLAERFGGEIVCADSRTVYKGMDIGTAKPTAEERAAVPHHLLDVVEPDQPFNAAQFKELAVASIDDIHGRKKLPLLVGGTGLYIDAVIFDYAFLPPHAPDERDALAGKSVDELQAILKERGIALPENARNPRHLIRAIETNGAVAVKKGLRPDTLVLGMKRSRDDLERRIAERVDAMVAAVLVDEVRRLVGLFGENHEAFRTPGYTAFVRCLHGELTIEQAKSEFVRSDLDLAKRQRTWFRRNKYIQWIETTDEAVKIVARFLGTSA
jgi:tRNA dimethylallyltransferase